MPVWHASRGDITDNKYTAQTTRILGCMGLCCTPVAALQGVRLCLQELRHTCTRLEAAKDKAECRAAELEAELHQQRASAIALRQVNQCCWTVE